MNVRDLIKLHEGLRTTPYKDTEGYWTIGYGHLLNIDSSDLPTVWTMEYIEQVLDRDIEKAVRSCKSMSIGFDAMDEVRQAVLVDMCFNLGELGLSKFHKTLNFVWLKQYADAADAMLKSKWAGQVKTRAKRLAQMMRTGEWPKEA